MNTVRPCLFLVLFALAVRPALAAPGPVTRLVAPSGEVAIGTPITFSWQSIPESTWYLLWLGKGTPTALVMEQWYTAGQAGCAAGGTCTITVTAPVNAGAHVWFIQTWAAGEVGPWSPGMQFVVTAPHWSGKLPAARRFTLAFDDQAVLDHETGLVWQKTPGTVMTAWGPAQSECARTAVGGRRGWRSPTISELSSLIDFNEFDPMLPDGHPFVGVGGNDNFWTQTESSEAPGNFFYVRIRDGTMLSNPNAPGSEALTWCVRGASAGGQ